MHAHSPLYTEASNYYTGVSKHDTDLVYYCTTTLPYCIHMYACNFPQIKPVQVIGTKLNLTDIFWKGYAIQTRHDGNCKCVAIHWLGHKMAPAWAGIVHVNRHNIDARIQPAVAPTIPTDIPGLLTCIYKTITHIVSRYNRHKSVNSDSSNKNCSLGGSDFTHTRTHTKYILHHSIPITEEPLAVRASRSREMARRKH